jgi:hypothetical protein
MKFALWRSPDLDEPTRQGSISAGPQPPRHRLPTPRDLYATQRQICYDYPCSERE